MAGVAAVVLLAVTGSPRWKLTDIGVPKGTPPTTMTVVGLDARGDVLCSLQFGPPGRIRQEAAVWHAGRFTTLAYAGSTSISPRAINARGDVLALVTLPGSEISVLWHRRSKTVLPDGATALNDRDQVVGNSPAAHAFLWQDGRTTDLGTLGGKTSSALAINARGEVIGTSDTSDGAVHAFLWSAGKLTDLGSEPGLDSAPEAIDAGGEVVGSTEEHDSGNPVDAVVWKNGTMTKLGRFGAAASEAIGINDRGHILVGLINRNGDSSAAVLVEGTKHLVLRSLGGPAPSQQGGPLIPLRLNDADQVLGYGYLKNGARRSFVWQNGRTTVLPTFDGVRPPWGAATAIDDKGIIAGTSYLSNPLVAQLAKTEPHVVVWTPKG